MKGDDMFRKLGKSRHLTYLSSRLTNTPLAIEERSGKAVLNAVHSKLGLDRKAFADDECDLVEIETDGRGYEIVGSVAIIPILGELCHRSGYLDAMSGLTSYGSIVASIRKAVDDPAVTGILLDIDSPGGEVSGLYDAVDEIVAMRGEKPIWAFANERACSAAYMVASAADRIIVSRTSMVGSIGVICFHTDASGAYEKAGVKLTPIYAGAHKAEGRDLGPLEDDARARIQGDVDKAYAIFVSAVAANRGMDEADVRGTEAAVISGTDAVLAGLADECTSFGNALLALQSETDPNTQDTFEDEGMAETDEELKNKASKAKAAVVEDELDAVGDDEELDALGDDETELGDSDDEELGDPDEEKTAEADPLDNEELDKDEPAADDEEEPKPAAKKAKAKAADGEDEEVAKVAARRAQSAKATAKVSGRASMTADRAATISKICTQGGCPEVAESLIRKGGSVADARNAVLARSEIKAIAKRASSADPSFSDPKMVARLMKASGGDVSKAKDLVLNRLAARDERSAINPAVAGGPAVVNGSTLSGDADEIYARSLEARGLAQKTNS